MMPEADIVAFRGSVSNHWSRKSTADIVISWTWLYLSVAREAAEALAEEEQVLEALRARAWSGRAASCSRIGLTKRPMSAIALPYSS